MFLYRFGLFFYALGASFSTLFNEKARLLIAEKKETLKKLADQSPFSLADQVTWVHIASLREFEHVLPIMNKNKYHQERIILIGEKTQESYAIRYHFKRHPD